MFLTPFFYRCIFSRVFRPHCFLVNLVSMAVDVSLSLSKGAEQCHLVPLCPFLVLPLLWFSSHAAGLEGWSWKGRRQAVLQDFSSLSTFCFLLCSASQMFLTSPQSCCLFSGAASLLMLSPGVVLELKGVCIAEGTAQNAWLGGGGDLEWRSWRTLDGLNNVSLGAASNVSQRKHKQGNRDYIMVLRCTRKV